MIEVSDNTHAYDRGIKLPRYASAGIAEVWIADLMARTIERYTEPHGGIYRLLRTFTEDETVPSMGVEGLAFPLSELLG